ncbi:TPA: hypothetical protein OMS29_003439 [Klebsiella aerogenes]|nr:hypothetical protein [Klebsiella aerogenes]HCU2335224.1 hypothetical protein [Klebsiella aerogenes]
MVQQSQLNHSLLPGFINLFNKDLQHDMQSGAYHIHKMSGVVAINNEVTRQATMMAYSQDFWVDDVPVLQSVAVEPVVFEGSQDR